MKNQVDLKHSLSVFNFICEKGQRINNKYEFEGLTAWSDFDGYTCYLAFNQVTLTMFFHGKYHLSYDKASQFTAFNNKLKSIKMV